MMKKNIFLFIEIVFAILLMGFGCTQNNTDKDSGGKTNSEPIYNIRDTGPAGGLIFYDKGKYSYGWRYLEAAPQLTEWTLKPWGKWGTSVGVTGTAIGTGKNNTALIVVKLNEAPAESGRAAQLCDELIYGGYSDWFLPSKDELNQMYINLKSQGVGGFDNVIYWSSSEYSPDRAYIQIFGNGAQDFYNKDEDYRVRAIRAF